jgi:hypothetical protein
MGKPTLFQVFAQNSTMPIETAKLLAGDALNHKDLNGGLEHLRLIVQELGISGNSTSNSKLISHLRTHIPTITSKQSALYTGSEAHAQANMTSSNATAAGGAQSSDFGYYFQKFATAPPPSYLTNTHTQKPVLTCDQPGHASCYSLGYSKGLLNTRTSCSATTLNSFAIANPSQVNNFCSGYRVAAQQVLQQQR